MNVLVMRVNSFLGQSVLLKPDGVNGIISVLCALVPL